jgi:hypothetical protein
MGNVAFQKCRKKERRKKKSYMGGGSLRVCCPERERVSIGK